MDLVTIRLMYDYNRWINQRFLTWAGKLTAEQTRQILGASFDSVHGTLGHILGAEIAWLSRWKGVSPARRLGGEDFDSLEAIGSRWEQHQGEQDSFMETLTAEKLASNTHYNHPSGGSYDLPLGEQMLHVVNHGTHHRSELADMLTRLGYPPPKPTDLIRFCLERTGQA